MVSATEAREVLPSTFPWHAGAIDSLQPIEEGVNETFHGR